MQLSQTCFVADRVSYASGGQGLDFVSKFGFQCLALGVSVFRQVVQVSVDGVMRLRCSQKKLLGPSLAWTCIQHAGAVILTHPVAILRAAFCVVCRLSQFESLTWGAKMGAQ